MKAQTVKFSYAGMEIEGLLCPNGEYRIALSQAVALTLVPKNRSIKQLKALTSLSFPSHAKLKSNINSKLVNTITLEDFTYLVRWADKQGNKTAALIIDASVQQTITTAFEVAIGVEKTNRDTVKDFTEIFESKRARRSLTDTWKEIYEITGQPPCYGKHTLMLYKKIGLLDRYNEYKKQYASKNKQYTFRHDFLTEDERFEVTTAEMNLAFMIKKLNMKFEDALEKL